MDQDSSRRTVRLAGALTIERASSLKAELAAALSESHEVRADLSAVEDIDLACLQVFYAARKQALARGKTFHFTGSVPGRVVRRLTASGFLRGSPGNAEEFEASLADF